MDAEEIFLTARLLTEELALQIEQPAPNRMDITLRRRADLVTAVTGLRVKRLGYLACITGLDLGPDHDSLEVLYHFCPDAVFINLRVAVPKSEASIPSLCSIIPSAESFERESRACAIRLACISPMIGRPESIPCAKTSIRGKSFTRIKRRVPSCKKKPRASSSPSPSGRSTQR
jgi:hypothetical protein